MRMWGLDPKDSDRANPHDQLIPELCRPGHSPNKAELPGSGACRANN